MAQPWVKWSKGFARKPEVIRIAAKLGISRHHCASLLIERVYEWLDDNVDSLDIDSDGNAVILLGPQPMQLLDAQTEVPGLAEAMSVAGWLKARSDSLVFPNFSRHNGTTAKARALDASRKTVERTVSSEDSSDRYIPKDVRDEVLSRDMGICRYCGFNCKNEPGKHRHGLSYDHVVPVCQGGDSSISNVVIACKNCNMSKNGRTPEDAGMSLRPCPNPVQKHPDKNATRLDKKREIQFLETQNAREGEVFDAVSGCIARSMNLAPPELRAWKNEPQIVEAKIAEWRKKWPIFSINGADVPCDDVVRRAAEKLEEAKLHGSRVHGCLSYIESILDGCFRGGLWPGEFRESSAGALKPAAKPKFVYKPKETA